LCQR